MLRIIFATQETTQQKFLSLWRKNLFVFSRERSGGRTSSAGETEQRPGQFVCSFPSTALCTLSHKSMYLRQKQPCFDRAAPKTRTQRSLSPVYACLKRNPEPLQFSSKALHSAEFPSSFIFSARFCMDAGTRNFKCSRMKSMTEGSMRHSHAAANLRAIRIH